MKSRSAGIPCIYMCTQREKLWGFQTMCNPRHNYVHITGYPRHTFYGENICSTLYCICIQSLQKLTRKISETEKIVKISTSFTTVCNPGAHKPCNLLRYKLKMDLQCTKLVKFVKIKSKKKYFACMQSWTMDMR